MVHPKSTNKNFLFMTGHPIMEMTVLLLLSITMTAAAPLRHPLNRRTVTDEFSLMRSIQRLKAMRSERTEKLTESPDLALKTKEMQSPRAEKPLPLEIISIQAAQMKPKLRPRRAPQKGCQLGTCQVHNLANTLYRMSQTNGKDESKKASDPSGYGR